MGNFNDTHVQYLPPKLAWHVVNNMDTETVRKNLEDSPYFRFFYTSPICQEMADKYKKDNPSGLPADEHFDLEHACSDIMHHKATTQVLDVRNFCNDHADAKTELARNDALMRTLVGMNAMMLEFATDSQKRNHELWFLAAGKDPRAMRFFPADMLTDLEIISELVKRFTQRTYMDMNAAHPLQFSDLEMHDSVRLAILAVKMNPTTIDTIPTKYHGNGMLRICAALVYGTHASSCLTKYQKAEMMEDLMLIDGVKSQLGHDPKSAESIVSVESIAIAAVIKYESAVFDYIPETVRLLPEVSDVIDTVTTIESELANKTLIALMTRLLPSNTLGGGDGAVGDKEFQQRLSALRDPIVLASPPQ